MLQVTDPDIAYAEQILFGRTGVFDAERITFIKELNTCDLQAVPGSGKTTVLLAKLLILERYLPLDSKRGILVISHTNAAVDEIRSKIAAHCPKLFSSPNFVGTIQSFVDRFLAIPYYIRLLKKKPYRIDDEIYAEKAFQFSQVFLSGFTRVEQNNAKAYLNNNRNASTIRLSPATTDDLLTNKYMGTALAVKKPRSTPTTDWNATEKARVSEWLMLFKLRLVGDGYLCFDDAYWLATNYIVEFPRIIPILQQRFAFVFVDEMQDMDQHQYDLLETVFTGVAATVSVFQRIGDKNQAIFSDHVGAAEVWVDRTVVHQLNGSHRLTPLNAVIVEKLAFSPIGVMGHKKKDDGSAINILPHLLIYNDSNITGVVPKFASLIEQYHDSGDIPPDSKHPYKAVCWNTQDEEAKIRIRNFYPSFRKEHRKPKVNYDSLESHLYLFDAGSNAMGTEMKNLSNALLRVLRLEEITDATGHSYTKTSLNLFLQENHHTFFETLRLKFYIWSRDILRNRQSATLTDIKLFVPQVLAIFGKTQNHSTFFIDEDYTHTPPAATAVIVNPNMHQANGFQVEVTTVHASKGQTHTATLYLESYYQRTIAATPGNYESERLSGFMTGAVRPSPIHDYVKQSLKMAYVGFSRPTHFLCFAVHEDRYNAKLTGLSGSEWKVVRV
jgi:DNA helicase-2/ATP-dependent DNA helicase PcrA